MLYIINYVIIIVVCIFILLIIILIIKIFAYFSSNSTKTTPLFTYNEKLQGVLSRHRNPLEEKTSVKPCEKLKSHELEVSESEAQRTKPLDFRLNKTESVGKASDEKPNTDLKKDNSVESKRLCLPKDTLVISMSLSYQILILISHFI